MYLLDTNVVSELPKLEKGRINLGVLRWIQCVSQKDIFTNIIVLKELEQGYLSKLRKDPIQGENLRTWYVKNIPFIFENRILNLNQKTASICAHLNVPNIRPYSDVWIASSALEYDLILVTRNEKDFKNIPNLKTLNPFE